MRALPLFAALLVLAGVAISAQGITSNGRSGAQSEAARKAAEARRVLSRQERAAEQEAAALKAERMRALPPEIAIAVAKGRIAFDDLSFAEDGRVVPPGDPSPGAAAASSGRGLFLRIGGLALSAALIFGGLFTKARSQKTD